MTFEGIYVYLSHRAAVAKHNFKYESKQLPWQCLQ